MSLTPFEYNNCSEERTTLLAQAMAPLLRAGDLLILNGGLGAGKTFFTRALCHALGLPEEEAVTSPTFTLVHEYPLNPPLLHADLYRLGEAEEVFDLGLDTRRDEGAMLVIEWGAPFEKELGGQAIFLDLGFEPRSALVRGQSERAREVIAALAADSTLAEGRVSCE